VSQQINLYSPIFRKQPKVFSALTMAQAFALIVLVVAVFAYSISLQTSVLEIRAAESGRQLKSELERLKAYGAGASPAERAKALADRKKALEASLASHTQGLAAFDSGALGRAEGYSALLRALARTSMEGVWLTRIQFAEAGGELSITGRATRAELVPAYLERLRSQEALRGQEFSRLEITRGAVVEFVLSAGEPAK
jgi:Tfp pilus assembly protein PilN